MKRASDSLLFTCASVLITVCALLTLQYVVNLASPLTRPRDAPHPVFAELRRVSTQLELTTHRIHETLDRTHSRLETSPTTGTRLDSVDTRLAEMQRVLGALAESIKTQRTARDTSETSSVGGEEVVVASAEEEPTIVQNFFETDGESVDDKGQAPKRLTDATDAAVVDEKKMKKSGSHCGVHLVQGKGWRPSIYAFYFTEVYTMQNTQGHVTESDDDSKNVLSVVKQPELKLPPPYPHPGAVLNGWMGLVDPGDKIVALAAGRFDSHCDSVVWPHFVATLKKNKPPLLRTILYKHLSTQYREMLFGKNPIGCKAAPELIEAVYKGLPEHSLRFAFSNAKLSPEYKAEYKLAAWEWVMTSDVLMGYVVHHCLPPQQRARLLEQLKENAEWEKAFGRLWFEQRIEPLPLPVATGDSEVDNRARAAWLQRYNYVAAEARKRSRQALDEMIRTSSYKVWRYEFYK